MYVGGLPEDVRTSEIKDLFGKFGSIRDIDIKAPRPPGGTTFAFIEYDDDRDAEDAVRDRDGYKFDGTRLRVEIARGGRRGGPDDRPRGMGHGPPVRSEYKVIVENLPPNTSWQDLKDHMRKAGEVGFSEVSRGVGYVEYSNADDMKYALRKLDDSEFVSAFTGGRSYIRVREDRPRGRSADRDRRSRSRSPRAARSRSPRAARSRSPVRKSSRSRSPVRKSVSPAAAD